MRPGAVRRRLGPHPPGGEILLNFELDVLVGEALGLFLAEDEHGLLSARVHEKLHVARRGVMAGRIHEVLGDRDEPQIDVSDEHALRVMLHLGDDLPRGADDPREPVTVGHRLALRVGAAELLLHLRCPDLAGAQGERPRRERVVLRTDGALLVGEGGRGVGHPDGPRADVHLLVLGGHGGHVVRNVVLPALKAAQVAVLRREDGHHGGVAVAPHGHLVGRGLHLAVLAQKVAGRPEPQLREVQAAAVLLGDGHADVGLRVAGRLGEASDLHAGNLHRLAIQLAEQIHALDGAVHPDPPGISRNDGLREPDDLGARVSRLAYVADDLVDGRIGVVLHGSHLHGSDFELGGLRHSGPSFSDRVRPRVEGIGDYSGKMFRFGQGSSLAHEERDDSLRVSGSFFDDMISLWMYSISAIDPVRESSQSSVSLRQWLLDANFLCE